jgi:hypothetical protein
MAKKPTPYILYARAFFLFGELAVSAIIISLSVLNYGIYFDSFINMQAFHIILLCGIFIPLLLMFVFFGIVAISVQKNWGEQYCLSKVGNIKTPKAVVVLIDGVLLSVLLTGLWDLLMFILYLVDNGWSYITLTTYIYNLNLVFVVLYLPVWLVGLLGILKTTVAFVLIFWEAYYWIGKDRICEVLFKPP